MTMLNEDQMRKIKRRSERDSVTVALSKQTEHSEAMIVAAFTDRNKLLDHIETLERHALTGLAAVREAANRTAK
jgi:hypothetical protein